jgi:antirestriction protein ArdC
MKADIYQAITARFIEQLKRGTVPWQKPWFAVQNIVSRKPYRGINTLLLGSRITNPHFGSALGRRSS